MEDRERARMRKYGESKTTRIMMATVPYVISGLGLRKFQADGFLLTRVYKKSCWLFSLCVYKYPVIFSGVIVFLVSFKAHQQWKLQFHIFDGRTSADNLLSQNFVNNLNITIRFRNFRCTAKFNIKNLIFYLQILFICTIRFFKKRRLFLPNRTFTDGFLHWQENVLSVM